MSRREEVDSTLSSIDAVLAGMPAPAETIANRHPLAAALEEKFGVPVRMVTGNPEDTPDQRLMRAAAAGRAAGLGQHISQMAERALEDLIPKETA